MLPYLRTATNGEGSGRKNDRRTRGQSGKEQEQYGVNSKNGESTFRRSGEQSLVTGRYIT